MEDARLAKLSKYFNDVIFGRRSLTTPRDGKLFIESICAQTDHATCVHKLISNAAGLPSLQRSMRFDTSVTFLNENAPPLLLYLQEPTLLAIDSGSVLTQVLMSIVEPPFFLDAYTKAFINGVLNTVANRAYAWLLWQLVSQPGGQKTTYILLAKTSGILDSVLKAPDGETRIFGQKIKNALPLDSADTGIDSDDKPGGRHDNDHADYRKISIMPTTDELLSKDRPFFRTVEYLDDPNYTSSRSAMHLDNQFRLLREDMLGEIREEIQLLTNGKTNRHKGIILNDLRVVGVEMGEERKRQPWSIVFQCNGPLPQLINIKPNKRKEFLEHNRQILRQGNMACLLLDNEPVAFPTIQQDEEKLSRNFATFSLQFPNDRTLSYTLFKMKHAINIKLAQLDTATFGFEPFLYRLQDLIELPLADELLHWEDGKEIKQPTFVPLNTIHNLKASTGKDLQKIIGTKTSVKLDQSQMFSLQASLSQRVSLVQGPPGTGKSFIGALVAKVIHDYTKQVILIVCFTNHALDQFLEDLMDIGIPSEHMVRLGGKSTDRTKPLTLKEQTSVKLTATQWAAIDKLKLRLKDHEDRINDAFKRYIAINPTKKHLMEYLEFASEDLPFFDAFTVPKSDDGMTRVGKHGRAMDPYYLLDRWVRYGTDAGSLQHAQPRGAASIWSMIPSARDAYRIRWQNAIMEDLITEIREVGRAFNTDQAELSRVFDERDSGIIKSKRIIACTTNGAAKFSSAIQSACPGVVLVEEAGEILEAHILTSLGLNTQQLILIGDHKQLRPKCSHELSVARGDGFDLNRSLFERLVLKGFPHTTLTQQHRMRPEISAMVRHLTYPDLTDAPSTLQREDLRGFRDNVIFVNHSEGEVELKEGKELRDGKISSKQNLFEAKMVLKCVRYLAQQGYGSDHLVVLTPYLGQLKLLREQLSQDNDPILNDLDKYDLLRAGLLTDLSSKTSKPSLRISTIDNYQGEESKIVIVSMTRSNKRNDIGFMSAPERLNVLLSRARNALIMIGNANTFMKSRNGREIWTKLFDHMKEKGHIYEGFPVKCEKHPDRTVLLSSPADFELHCPDGGCQEPCGALLKCGKHKCLSSCHQIFDHSKMKCMIIEKRNCPNGHEERWYCHGKPPSICGKCEKERKDAEKQVRKDLEEKLKREEKTRKHQLAIAKIEADIEDYVQKVKDVKLDQEQAAVLAQKQQDLAAARERADAASKEPLQIQTASPQVKTTLPFIQAQTTLPQTRSSSPQIRPNSPQIRPNSPQTQNSAGGANKASPSKKIASPKLQQNPQQNQQPPATTTVSKSQSQDRIKISVDQNKSPSMIEWQRQKDQENAVNPSIDRIMGLIGLEDVKAQVLRIKAKVETSIRQNTDLKKERLGLVLLGNPGTGKTTVARHYANILTSMKVLSGNGFVETTGSRLAHGGVTEVKNHFKQLENSDGGVYFIDEAYQLAEGHNAGGKTVLDFLLAEIENLVGRVVFVFAGYRKQMEKFFEHNPGFSSRIPYELRFEDYTDEEFLKMLQLNMAKFYKNNMAVEGGPDGLYMRVAVRRLGRGRGTDGFGNARALANLFAKIRERQAARLSKERREGLLPDDYFMTKEDLIGPNPSDAILKCDAWTELQKLTGLKSVKESVSFLIDLIKTNYERELKEQPLVQVSLNRVFLGSPGTGKTTVAKLYGRILADIGLLSNGEVITKNPADFVGGYVGQSEVNTKAILATTVGKVLIIDEAYMLYSGSRAGGGSTGTDTFKMAVIDTIVAEIQSVPGEDRCVLLLGYEHEMVEMFQNVNPGLTRRFQLSDAFRFEDFTDSELEQILRHKLKAQGLGATDQAITVAIQVLSRKRNGLNFGNGGDVVNIISKAQSNYQARQRSLSASERSTDFIFEPQDFDPDFNRASGAEMNLKQLFEGVIGCENIIEELDGFLKTAKGMRTQGIDPRGRIPMNFIFKGPPGTGKTTTARKIGQVYFDLGFLSQAEVVECSASDLIGQYIGQTGPKTIKQLELGLGKVLFIDEAYRLGEGHFAQEAVNELVDNMTKEKFIGKMVIILAGYENDMNKLLQVNEGLGSRFPNEFMFYPLNGENSLQVLESALKRSQVIMPSIHDPAVRATLLAGFSQLSNLPSWGNARDVQTLATRMIGLVYQTTTEKVEQLILPTDIALKCINGMIEDRQKRANIRLEPRSLAQSPAQSLHQDPPPLPKFDTSSTSTPVVRDNTEPEEEEKKVKTNAPQIEEHSDRDPGVTDAVWEQLQRDKAYAEAENQRMADEIRQQEKLAEAAAKAEQEKIKQAALLKEAQDKIEAEALKIMKMREEERIQTQAKIDAMALELFKKREQARIQELEARAMRKRIEAELERVRKAQQEAKRKEQQAQAKLRHMGICPAGFRWIKQVGGYRCTAGGHYVTDGQLGI